MIFLDATIVNVALPDIQRQFGVGEQGLQWVVAAYSLTMGMFIMSSATPRGPTRTASRVRGRRRGVRGRLGRLRAGTEHRRAHVRPAAVQGIGAAMVNVSSLALVSAAYPDPDAKAKAIGAWTGIAAIGLAIGPTLGGVLTEGIGWRSIFLINVVVAAVAIILVLRFAAESKDPIGRSIDPVGQVLFIVGVGTLTYALIEAPHSGWTSPLILGSLVGVSGRPGHIRARRAASRRSDDGRPGVP